MIPPELISVVIDETAKDVANEGSDGKEGNVRKWKNGFGRVPKERHQNLDFCNHHQAFIRIMKVGFNTFKIFFLLPSAIIKEINKNRRLL